jgi:hypothetical protein
MIARVALVAILALSLPTPAWAVTFGEIAAWCAPADQGGHPNLCSGYVDTELELLASPDPTMNGGTRVCVPAGTDRTKLVTLIRDYARSHPNARDLDAVVGLGQALSGHFPCRGK